MVQVINSSRYDEIIEKLKSKISYYEFSLEDNKYFLGLANGDYINLTFPRNNIPHLLGIYTDKLKAANIVRGNSSTYDILKKIVNEDLTYMNIKNTNKNFDISGLFSEFIDNKIDIFIDILKVRTDDMYCIIKYNDDRTYTTGEERENSDYFIIRKHDKAYSVLGIVKGDNYNNYVPVTARYYNNYDELREFLNKIAKNQEVTYPYTFRIENYSKEYSRKLNSNLDNKLEFNRNLKDVADKYGAIPSTNKDFITIIEKSLNNKQKVNNNSSILGLIRENIVSGNIIDKEEVREILDDSRIPMELELLIDACNDFICSRATPNKDVNNSYSSIENENTSLKEQLQELRQEVLSLKETKNEIEDENTRLKNENNSNKQKLKVLTTAYEQIKEI